MFWSPIVPQSVNTDQIPASARRLLGEDRALTVAKNLVRHGFSPDALKGLSPETAQRLSDWADKAEYANSTVIDYGAPDSGSTSGGRDVNGVLVLDDQTVTGRPRTSGEAFLQSTAKFRSYLGTLPVEKAEIALIGMQALMGPVKAAVSLAGGLLSNSLFGDKVDALKEYAAVGTTAGLISEERTEVQEEHDYAKQEYAESNKNFDDGDSYVLASKFLIDLAIGGGGLLAGRAVLKGAKATAIGFLPKATRNSAGQIEANITQSSAIKLLESSGYKKTVSQDGTVTVLTGGKKVYRFYPSSTSTGQPSASLTIEGIKKPVTKIRFSGE